MEEDLTIPGTSTSNMSVVEGEKVKDFVYQHFKDKVDGSLISNVQKSSVSDQENASEVDKESPHKTHCRAQLGAVFSGKILSFGCSVCKGTCTFSPNDLLKHFQAVHKGILPTYPCDLCDFFTNEFQLLQRHRIEHRNPLVNCELCNDDIQYSLLLLTRHYIMCHSVNGLFKCDWCQFSTLDAGTFVQHIHLHNETHWKCSKCRHISLSEASHQKHMRGHSGTFPYTCLICGFGVSKSELLDKHRAAVHKAPVERTAWRYMEDSSTPSNSSTSLKLLHRNTSDLLEAQRLPNVNNCSGNLPNQNGRLGTPEVSLEETSRLIESCKLAVANKERLMNQASHQIEPLTQPMQQECDNPPSSDTVSNANGNGLAMLMLKNKISIPPNCTTKVLGFRVVDGKKHLVLKVISTEKQDPLPLDNSLVECVRSTVLPPVGDKVTVPVEIKQCPAVKGSTSHCPDIPPKAPADEQMAQSDILSVKVKLEEDETPLCNLNSIPHRENAETDNSSQNRTVIGSDKLCPLVHNLNNNEQGHPDQLGETLVGNGPVSPNQNSDVPTAICSKSSHSTIVVKSNGVTAKVAQKTLISKPVSRKNVENSEAMDELLVTEGGTILSGQHTGNSASYSLEKNNTSFQTIPEKQDGWMEEKPQNGATLSSHLVSSLCSRDKTSGSEICAHNLQNQDVFTFHNYSKETFSTLPNTTENIDGHMSEHSNGESACASPRLRLALTDSPENFSEGVNNGLEVDEGSDHSLPEENPDSVLKDFNIIKIEEDCIPISKHQPETESISASIGDFVEEHPRPALTETTSSDKTAANGGNHPLKQTKTSLRFFQLPDGKQPVLLKAADKILSRPEQVTVTPGFKLISNSSNPQINVTYMTPGSDREINTPDLTVPPNIRGSPTSNLGTVEKGTALLSTLSPGCSTASNHYLFNGQGIKAPVLLSSTPHNASADKRAKAQPTRYFIQRSVPFVQTPRTPFKPGTTRPILAMPVSSTDKPNTLQTNRQTLLVRYISSPISGQLATSQDDNKSGIQSYQTSERSGNKVIFKIVTPTGGLLTSGAPASCNQPLFLATRPQIQCLLDSSNKSNASASNIEKKMVSIENTEQKDVQESCILGSQMNVKVQQCAVEKPILAPRPIRPPSQRKRNRKILFDELPQLGLKARKLSNRMPIENESTELWTPVAKEVERTLRLSPFSSKQNVKCPRRYQPVVVLNHPDADIPEVANIMKVVARHKGDVTKVALSQQTLQALSVFDAPGRISSTKGASLQKDSGRTGPVQSSVRERFLLRMKLRKRKKKKYEVVKSLSSCKNQRVFSCWFCGRLFNSQEDWIGHGQRHLMEATRDWNELF